MSSNNNFNNMMDDSYHTYIKQICNCNKNSIFYRIFDYNNNNNEHIIINGKIDKIVNYPKNLNLLLNIDSSYGNIIHIPMMSDMYIDYMTQKHLINIKDLDIKNAYKSDNDKIKFLSVKNNKKMIYQDIIIHIDNNIIIVQIYKCNEPINDITHGAFIIYQNNLNMNNQNNSIFYTKYNSNLLIDDIKNISTIYNNLNKFNCN
jgi:hypothetical protein